MTGDGGWVAAAARRRGEAGKGSAVGALAGVCGGRDGAG